MEGSWALGQGQYYKQVAAGCSVWARPELGWRQGEAEVRKFPVAMKKHHQLPERSILKCNIGFFFCPSGTQE